jgi:ribosome recycling factor
MDFPINEKMKKAIDSLQENLSTIRAGRANPAILNKINVEYYGVPTPISQVASISVPEARMIVIQPWDANILKDLEKEIIKADIGIMPNNDGKVIRLNFPELTEDRRKEIVKNVKKLGEDSKIVIRNIRRDAIDFAKNLKKNNEISEDELSSEEDNVQKITDKFVTEIDNIISAKEKEVMQI